MKCAACGQNNPKDSKFCQHCGSAAVNVVTERATEANRKFDELWKKFIEIYNPYTATTNENYKKHMPGVTVAFITHGYKESAGQFFKVHERDLHNTSTEAMKCITEVFLESLLGGYFIWVAEMLTKGIELIPVPSVNEDELLKEWEISKHAGMKSAPVILAKARFAFLLMAKVSQTRRAKKLHQETGDRLTDTLFRHIDCGYHFGAAEYNLSK